MGAEQPLAGQTDNRLDAERPPVRRPRAGVGGATCYASPTPGQPTAVIAAPMLIDDRLVGVITAVSFKPGKRFTREHAALYARAASLAGVVVDQRRRIDALESQGVSGEEPRRPSGDEPLARQILDTAARLVDRNPDRLRELARLLSALDDILGVRGP